MKHLAARYTLNTAYKKTKHTAMHHALTLRWGPHTLYFHFE